MVGDGRLGEIVQTVRDRRGIPALGAIIVIDGVISEQAVDGVRSISASIGVTTADQWHIGSVTKAMTATLAGILVEQSLITWDTTPDQVWPEYAATMQSQYRSATLVQLLAHQSGLPSDIAAIPSIDLTRDAAPGSLVEKRRIWARELLELAPANAVGDYLYSNAGYIVAGAMLETVVGVPWEELMVDRVFAPLGMADTGFGAPGTAGQLDQPWGHRDNGPGLTAVPPGPDADSQRAIGPAGNVHTTMADYALFMFTHLEGERGIPGLVSTDTYRFLHAPVGGSDYALGWNVDDRHPWAQGPLLFHLGTNLRWIANAGIIPGLNAGVLIVTNAADENAAEASDELANLLLMRIRDSQ